MPARPGLMSVPLPLLQVATSYWFEQDRGQEDVTGTAQALSGARGFYATGLARRRPPLQWRACSADKALCFQTVSISNSASLAPGMTFAEALPTLSRPRTGRLP